LVSAIDDRRNELVLRLKGAGYAVVTAPTPESALEKIEKVSPNVIVSHMAFSGSKISGVKLLHLLRASPKVNFVPFVLLGSEQESEEVGQTNLRPNEGFLVEPADFEELTSIMEQKIAVFKEYIASLN
jgi:DNA-binding response OmpR family regulator